MRNLSTRYSLHTDLKLANLRPHCVKILDDLSGVRVSYVAYSNTTDALTISCRRVPSASTPISEADNSGNSQLSDICIETAFDSTPVSLCVLEGGTTLVVCCRGGEIWHIDPQTGVYDSAGEVIDSDPSRSGILAAAASPDGNLIVLISPVKTLVLDTAWELVAEVEHQHTLAVAATVCWRGDGAFFVASVQDTAGVVSGVVVDRDCADVKRLDVADLTGHDGLGMTSLVSWQPRVGGMICAAGPGNALSFFERNGLRHLRSDVRLGHTSTESDGVASKAPTLLSWSADSTMLAVSPYTGQDQVSFVDIYTKNNYKWYKKKRFEVYGQVVAVCWDEDYTSSLYIVTAEGLCVLVRLLSVPSSTFCFPIGAHGAVVDGDCVVVTNFSNAVVPPPMNHGVLRFDEAVNELCALSSENQFGALLSNGLLTVVSLRQPLSTVQFETEPIPEKELFEERNTWRISASPSKTQPFISLRAPVFLDLDICVVVFPSAEWKSAGSSPCDHICVYRLKNGEAHATLLSTYSVDGHVVTLSKSDVIPQSLVCVTSKGSIVQFTFDENSEKLVETAHTGNVVRSETISIIDVLLAEERSLGISQDETGNLQAYEYESGQSISLSRECTSWAIHEGFLIFTTRSHLLYCIVLNSRGLKSYKGEKDESPSLIDMLDNSGSTAGVNGHANIQLPEGDGATRPIDRGSVIVATVPNDVSIVLQAPRGNLETISPRPVVFETVDMHAKVGDYGKAFDLCRRHRVDMNHIVDADYDTFVANIHRFVEQIGKAGHLSIFLTFLKGDNARVNTVCDSIVDVLVNLENRERFTSTVLTGLIRRQPPDHKRALDQVRKAFETNEEDGVAALDYLFVLVKDEKEVYHHALGTYDLKLALTVAKSSQIDPAEYSQELKDLREAEEYMRKYTIDEKLGRYDSALRNLYVCGEDHYRACVDLCHKHGLYNTALELLGQNESYRAELLGGFGSFLRDAGKHKESASVFIQNGDYKSAAESYQEGGLWQFAVSAVSKSAISKDEKEAMYGSIAEDLINAGKAKEAARVMLCILNDVDGAIAALARAEEWECMFEAVTTYVVMHDLGADDEGSAQVKALWDEVTTQVTEGAQSILATLEENHSKVRDRRKRLEAVREAKQLLSERLGQKSGNANGVETESDVFSESTVSSLASNLSDITFTSKTSATSLYTSISQTGPMSSAKLEKHAERRRQKAMRKRVREGHPREEEYLVEYLRKLVPLEFVRNRVRNIVGALLYINCVDSARKIIDEMYCYMEEVGLLPDDVLNNDDLRSAAHNRDWVIDTCAY